MILLPALFSLSTLPHPEQLWLLPSRFSAPAPTFAWSSWCFVLPRRVQCVRFTISSKKASCFFSSNWIVLYVSHPDHDWKTPKWHHPWWLRSWSYSWTGCSSRSYPTSHKLSLLSSILPSCFPRCHPFCWPSPWQAGTQKRSSPQNRSLITRI